MTNSPTPRDGALGFWDNLIGPDASVWEAAGTIAFGAIGAIGAPTLVRRARRGSGPLEWVIAAGVGLDVAALAWASETPSSKRWWHRKGSSRIGRIVYASTNVQAFVVEAASRRFEWRSATISYVTMVGSAAVLEVVPEDRRRSTAQALYTVWLAGTSIAAPPPSGYAWLPAVLGYKVIIGQGTPRPPLARLGHRRR
jgi:hypothetical protein